VLEFATSTYGVTFPMFAKIEVNGPGAAPLYQWLKQCQPGSGDSPDIVWNFTKFLIDSDGNAVKRYEPQVTPAEIAADLAEYL
jgi:glutathione peroxidase